VMSVNTPAEKFLRDMVAIPSITGREGLMKDYLAETFGGIGLDVELQHVDGDRYNVIGKLGDGPVRLMLCTHTDVIPALDDVEWHTPPFEATMGDDRIYGRGTADAKGPLAAAMEAIQRAHDINKGRGAVALAAVVEEETGRSVGARKLMEAYRPEAGIILEPTGLRVAIAHKGALRPVITVRGRAAHSSASPGVNAVWTAGEILRGLEQYRDRVMSTTDPMLGRASLEVTMVRCGERINVMPERCEIYVDRRLVSEETVNVAYDELKGVVEHIGADDRVDVKLLCSYPSSSVDEKERIVELIKNALAGHGLPAAPVGFPAGCDMWTFRANGIPTAILGPGHIGQAHGADEYIEREQLKQAADLYEGIIAAALRPS
jgi:acetylornithine deacetylase/succinyl-diaminopimelate desuccinylase-like protein